MDDRRADTVTGFILQSVGSGVTDIFKISAKELLKGHIPNNYEPFASTFKSVLEHGLKDSKLNNIYKNSLNYFFNEMDLSKVTIAFVRGSNDSFFSNTAAMAQSLLIHDHFAIVPLGNKTIPKSIIDEFTPLLNIQLQKYKLLTINISKINDTQTQGYIEILHEIVHIADTHRLNRIFSQLDQLPIFFDGIKSEDRWLIPKYAYIFFTELRAYSGEMSYLAKSGSLRPNERNQYLKDCFIRTFYSLAQLGFQDTDPLKRFNILKKDKINLKNFREMANNMEKWILTEMSRLR